MQSWILNYNSDSVMKKRKILYVIVLFGSVQKQNGVNSHEGRKEKQHRGVGHMEGWKMTRYLVYTLGNLRKEKSIRGTMEGEKWAQVKVNRKIKKYNAEYQKMRQTKVILFTLKRKFVYT